MRKADDSSLDPEQLRAVEERARSLLNRADAWGRYPTPIEDILAAAKIKVAPKSIFDLQAVAEYLRNKAAKAAHNLKSAISKVLGLYDPQDVLIHIDNTVTKSKQTFLTLHETGHHEIPAHKKTFKLFEDCNDTLSPEISDLFEREANNFARFALFQGDAFASYACDLPLDLKSPRILAGKFGASQYAAAREFARTNHRSCVVYVLNPVEYVQGDGFRAAVRRIEPSPSFRQTFGLPRCTVITPDHFLGPVVPLYKKRMSAPRSVTITDLNGTRHDCVAEAFNTTHNIIILLFPTAALTAKIVLISAAG
ncbi:MAG: ImmA/IrrE family metallo-endopeptidase [Pyrinomonadaceae bacterium]|nr:ImmA/IrrE family metallo-endopeptidase [Xanthobacteraceae bacterium]